MSDPLKTPIDPPVTAFVRSVKAVAWSFLGIRKRSEFQEDLSRINPLHIIAAGILGVLLLILTLIIVVKLVVAG